MCTQNNENNVNQNEIKQLHLYTVNNIGVNEGTRTYMPRVHTKQNESACIDNQGKEMNAP